MCSLKISFLLPCTICCKFCSIFSKFISLSRGKSPTGKHCSDLRTQLKSHYPTIFLCRQSMKRPGFAVGVEHFSCCSSIAVKLVSHQDLPPFFFPDICVQFHLKDADTALLSDCHSVSVLFSRTAQIFSAPSDIVSLHQCYKGCVNRAQLLTDS